MTPWSVAYSRQFHGQLEGLAPTTYARVEESIDVLSANPGLARPYDPPYEAACPPQPCLWYAVPKTTKVLFLVADECARTIRVFFMADARMDPHRMFESLEW